MVLSDDSDDNDLAVEGRFKADVARIGLSDRSIEGEDGLLVSPGLFRSGSMGSKPASVFDPLVDGLAEMG